jgi:uracil-DNA glycosylase
MEVDQKLKEQQLALVSKVFPEEYINIMSDRCIQLFCRSFISISKQYPDTSDSGYRTDGEKLLYPKLRDLGKPYKLCPLDKLKAVVVGVEPYNNGESTGIPFQFKMEYRSKFQIQIGQQNVDCIDECVGLNFECPEFPFWHGIDWEKLLEQGVLVIHASLTSEEKGLCKHFKTWHEFTKEFLNCIHKHNKDIPVLSIGDVLRKTLISLPKSLKIIAAPDAYYEPEHRMEFRRFMPFQRLNRALNDKGLDLVEFSRT